MNNSTPQYQRVRKFKEIKQGIHRHETGKTVYKSGTEFKDQKYVTERVHNHVEENVTFII